MKLTTIETGLFKLDGGAMFGVVPRSMWAKLNPPDENNMCTWSMRCLLIETGDRKILVDTGIGDKQNEKFRSHFHPHGDDTLLGSLKAAGCGVEDITDVFFTHLHFDHCGGGAVRNADGDIVPTFPNATYWTNQKHWDWAYDPNPRERASFLKENMLPLQEAGVLKMIKVNENGTTPWIPGINIHFSYGHTEAMMALEIETAKGTVLYAADVMPSRWHVPLTYVMSYDIRPLVSIAERAKLLERGLAEDWIIFFEHDPLAECGRLTRNKRNRIVTGDTFSLSELFEVL